MQFINGRFVSMDEIDAPVELQVTHRRLSIATDALHMIQGSTTNDASELKTYARQAIAEIERTDHAGIEREAAQAKAEAASQAQAQAEDAGEAPQAGPVATNGEG